MRRAILPVMVALVPALATAQGLLGPEFRVNTYVTSGQRAPSVSRVDGFVITWASYGQDGSDGGIFGQRYSSAGAPVGPEFRINTYTTDRQIGPSVASDSTGNFVVAWSSYQSGTFNIAGQRFDASGVPQGTEFRVNTSTNQYGPSVAADSVGDFVVVWSTGGAGGTPLNIRGQRYRATGASDGSEFLVNTYVLDAQYTPAVGRTANGDFVVVWTSFGQDGNAAGVFGQRFNSAGAPQGPEFQVNTFVAGYQREPTIGISPGGDFVVAWTSQQGQDGDKDGVFAQRFAASGAPAGPEFQVNTYTTSYQNRPTVAMDASGNFVVVWRSTFQDGGGGGAFGQRYASSGAPLGTEFRVNSYTPNNQNDPSVASEALGNFVVVWESVGQDGSSYGIFGQRYGPILPVELTHFLID